MSRRATRAAASAGVGVVLLALIVAVPPRARSVSASWTPEQPVIAGAFHVHTNRSDGGGSIDEVAAAAARAGLQFIVVTDHGDGTRPLEPPSYRSGVLVIDGVEISTSGGHYAVFGMQPAPYPLGGDARDVVDDVARLGGFGAAAHADSPKADLAWTDRSDRVDAIEWLNLDTVWRQATSRQIAKAAIGYWFRPPETLASVMTRPAATLEWLDVVARQRRIVTLAASDAHGSLASSYEPCFRTISTRVELPAPLRGHALADAQTVMAALRAGHHYAVVDGMAKPTAFEFVGRRASTTVRQGGVVPAGTRLEFEARVAAPGGAVLMLLRDGVCVRQTSAATLTYQGDGRPGAYRVEARIDGMPWVVSNPIFVGLPGASDGENAAAAARLDALADAGSVWHTEHDRSSTAALVREHGSIVLRYALGGGAPRNQFAAIVLPVPERFPAFDRVTLRVTANAPVRLSVQLRELGNRNPPRWRRGVFVDKIPRTYTVFFDDMTPVAPNTLKPVSRARIGGLLLLVDTTNTRPGTAGEIVFSDVGIEGR